MPERVEHPDHDPVGAVRRAAVAALTAWNRPWLSSGQTATRVRVFYFSKL